MKKIFFKKISLTFFIFFGANYLPGVHMGNVFRERRRISFRARRHTQNTFATFSYADFAYK